VGRMRLALPLPFPLADHIRRLRQYPMNRLPQKNYGLKRKSVNSSVSLPTTPPSIRFPLLSHPSLPLTSPPSWITTLPTRFTHSALTVLVHDAVSPLPHYRTLERRLSGGHSSIVSWTSKRGPGSWRCMRELRRRRQGGGMWIGS